MQSLWYEKGRNWILMLLIILPKYAHKIWVDMSKKRAETQEAAEMETE